MQRHHFFPTQFLLWCCLSWLTVSSSTQLPQHSPGCHPRGLLLPPPAPDSSLKSGWVNFLIVSPTISSLFPGLDWRSALSIYAGTSTIHNTQITGSSLHRGAGNQLHASRSLFLLSPFLELDSPLIHLPFPNLSKFNSDITSCRNDSLSPRIGVHSPVCFLSTHAVSLRAPGGLYLNELH